MIGDPWTVVHAVSEYTVLTAPAVEQETMTPVPDACAAQVSVAPVIRCAPRVQAESVKVDTLYDPPCTGTLQQARHIATMAARRQKEETGGQRIPTKNER